MQSLWSYVYEVTLNQKQYIRLSIVLAVPTLAFSLYLGQQDVIHERGQFVQCSVSEANCSAMINTSTQVLHKQLRYFVYPTDRLLGLYNIDIPMKISFETIDGEMLDVSSLVDSKMLETNSCYIWSNKDVYCEYEDMRRILPYLLTRGRIEFINPEDEIAFNNIVEEGESYFEDYTLHRIFEGFGLFFIFATPYLIFSWLVHFVIYGARISSEKKRPYQ
ncbi:hypothetical protein JCM18900_11457 [Psychrobacter sp. JCM 18900]|nr:hypothetical protein JCM18900_11457 [Psychrobacter sp. JCM 18900]